MYLNFLSNLFFELGCPSLVGVSEKSGVDDNNKRENRTSYIFLSFQILVSKCCIKHGRPCQYLQMNSMFIA